MLSIVLLNYNMKGLLTQCLSGINPIVPTPCEPIIVSNASTDGSRIAISEWTDRQPFERLVIRPLLRDRNDGYAVGNNAGLRLARNPLILILNPDMSALNGSIAALLNYASSHPEAALIGPKLLYPNGAIQYSC